MTDRNWKLGLAGVVLIGVMTAPAFAYLPEGKTFRERAGSAASLGLADVASDPTAQVLKSLVATARRQGAVSARNATAPRSRSFMPSATTNRSGWSVDAGPRRRRGSWRPIADAASEGLDPAAYRLPLATIGENDAGWPRRQRRGRSHPEPGAAALCARCLCRPHRPRLPRQARHDQADPAGPGRSARLRLGRRATRSRPSKASTRHRKAISA